MSKRIYFFPIEVESLEEGGFLATCQTLQGRRAEGQTHGQAIENIQDIIRIHLEAQKAHRDPLSAVFVPSKTSLRLSFPLPVTA